MKNEPSKKFNVNKHSSIYFWMGVNISLLLLITAFEWESKYDTILMNKGPIIEVMPEIMPITEMEEKKPPKPKVIAPVLVETTEELDEIQPEIVLDLEDLTDDEIDEIIDSNPAAEEIIETYENAFLDSKAAPIDGYAGFYKFIRKNLKYPRAARTMNIEGKVFVSFVIDEKGEITDLIIIRGIGMGCDEETLRVMRLLPAWKAGLQAGHPVRARMVLPITFKLSR